MFNFGGFGFPGFEEGGFPGGPPEDDEEDDFDPYECLGVAKDATQAQIKKAYRKAAISHHPDRGGDAEKFKEAQQAWEILGDADKRELFDQYGMKGVKRGGPPGPTNLFDLVSGGRSRGPRGKRKGRDVQFPLRVDLEALYRGATKKLRLTRSVLCESCKGSGGKEGKKPVSCSSCHGHGVKVMVRQLGPGMIEKSQVACDQCKGQGKRMKEEDKCSSCKGDGTVKKSETLEVIIDKGMKDGERIVFSGQADEAPDMLPGDVVVILQQKEHDLFHREGPDLIMEKKISLVEALCGTELFIKQLDDRVLKVDTKGETIQPNSLKVIEGEGMPQHRNPYNRGDLIIKFEVVFPEAVDAAMAEQLRQILPASGPSDPNTIAAKAVAQENPSHVETHHKLGPFDVEAAKARRKAWAETHREAYHEDDDREEQVGCRSQ
eukprot:GABV01000398.1.p1 GENE.GABV01000398.1~~GABV01000398.1.p1  ORF type:complete len:434 (-),score=186.93 GABV01000398.1:47-1348(-)